METREYITITIAAGTFVAKTIYDFIVKRNSTREKLEAELIHTSDKMLRKFLDNEFLHLEYNRHLAILDFQKNKIDKLTEKEKYELTELKYYIEYFHKTLSQSSYDYELLKSDLKKNLKDANRYLPRENRAKALEVIERIVYFRPRRFDEFRNRKFASVDAIEHEYGKLQDGVKQSVFFESVGFHLIYLQKLIDQQTPTLYFKTSIQLRNMYDKLKNYDVLAKQYDERLEQIDKDNEAKQKESQNPIAKH